MPFSLEYLREFNSGIHKTGSSIALALTNQFNLLRGNHPRITVENTLTHEAMMALKAAENAKMRDAASAKAKAEADAVKASNASAKK